MRNSASLLVALALGCGAPAATISSSAATSGATTSAEEGYPVQLSRPVAVGDQIREQTQHVRRQTQRVFVNEQLAQEEVTERALELVAVAEVREINARGAATISDYTIERAMLRDATGEHEVVPAGSVIRVTRVPPGEGEGSIELVGGALSEEATEALDIAFSTTVSQTGDDGVFGSETPRRVGESWPIDAARAAQDLNKIPSITIAENQVGGETRLEAVEEVRGVECLRIRGEMRAEGFTMNGLPPGAEVTSASMSAVMTGAFPLDVSMGRIAESEAMEMRFSIRLPDAQGMPARMEMVVEDESRSEYER